MTDMLNLNANKDNLVAQAADYVKETGDDVNKIRQANKIKVLDAMTYTAGRLKADYLNSEARMQEAQAYLAMVQAFQLLRS